MLQPLERQSDAFPILKISLILLEEEGADEEGDDAGDIKDQGQGHHNR
ncbi:hypothetical protein [Rossellomorea marisflavi]